MNRFVEAMKQESEMKRTENDALAFNTTKHALLDLFGTIGALRNRSEEDIIDKFSWAFKADPILAVKMLFYAGDVRGGLGERRTFRIIIKWLAKNHPEWAAQNARNIAYYNRWDSVFELIDTPAEYAMWVLIEDQLIEDIDNMELGNPISLLAKWLPSPKTSSINTMQLAKRIRKGLGLNEKGYRKILSKLRAHINVVETKMSAGKWEDIEFNQVPSYAMKNYANAFARNCGQDWLNYIEKVEKGEEKIVATTLYPYDLVGQIRGRTGNDRVIEAQWKALPDYLEEEEANVLVMADVSGSMNWPSQRPMNTSIGLALYFAQRNKGDFAGTYMTFTDTPHFMTVNKDKTLKHLVHDIENKGVGYNTNLEKAFEKILELAVGRSIPQADLPKALVVISDMEIDYYIEREGLDFVETMKLRFEEYGYKMPQLICWNVEARNDTFLTQGEDTLIVSGQSASTFRNLVKGIGMTSFELMVSTLNDERYDRVVIVEN